MNKPVTSPYGDRPMCQIWSANIKLKNSYGPDKRTCKKQYIFEVKVHDRIWIMNVRNTLYYGDTLMCQIWYAKVKPTKSYVQDTKTCQNPLKLDLEVKVLGRIWMYATHLLMVIDPCAKYCKPMSNKKQ